ncbi:MAG: hypothetical protein ISR25_03785 [Candidatus Poseidoniaceae archaeon]|nr:hypothetical protein [Candidatus Poseidoniaceae archaeon]
MEDETPLTKMAIIRSLLSPSTAPHLLLLVITASLLHIMAKVGTEQIASFGFISFSIAYVLLAPASNKDVFRKLITFEQQEESTFADSMKERFKILILPLAFGLVLWGIFAFTMGEGDTLSDIGTIIPSALGFLFVAWAIAQGWFFAYATSNSIKTPDTGTLKDASTHSPIPSLVTTSTLMISMTIIVTEAFRFSHGSTQFSVWPYVASFAVFALSVRITWTLRQKASTHTATHAVAKRWFHVTQLFITWHVLSIVRSIDSASSTTLIFIEELVLMIFTVFMAIWALTSKADGRKSTLFTKDNALFWGVAFGYAYAGSVAMITSVFDDLTAVLIGGHILVVATVVWAQRSLLDSRINRMFKDFDLKESVESIEIPPVPEAEETTPEEKLEASEEDDTTESIGDPVDWNQKPESIGDETNWEEDVELLD